MKKILLLNLLIIIGFSLFSQNLKNKVEVSYGEEFKIKERLLAENVIAEDETGFYSLKMTFEKFKLKSTLLHYDRKMNLIKASPIDISYTKKENKFEQLRMINGKLYLLTSTINKKQMKKELYIESVSKEKLSLNKDAKKIAEYDILKTRRKNSGFYDCILSKDESKTLVYYSLPFENETKEKFGFQVYDPSMNLIWEKEITLPYDDASFSIEDYKIGNNGDIYLVGRLYNSESSDYTYELLVYSSEADNVDQFSIKTKDSYISNIKVEVLDNQNILCAGFYSNTNHYNVIDGCYYMTLDAKSKDIIQYKSKAFDLNFLTQNMSEKKEEKAIQKAAKGKSIGLVNYYFNHIVTKKDGGYYLLAEQHYTTENRIKNLNRPGHSIIIEHFYNDIIVINVANDGEIDWNVKIPKRQQTKNDGGIASSYGTFNNENNLYLLFNDNPKNNNYVTGDKVYKYGTNLNHALTAIEINSAGEIKRESLLSKDDTKLGTRPAALFNISENEMILFGSSLKKSQYFKLMLK